MYSYKYKLMCSNYMCGAPQDLNFENPEQFIYKYYDCFPQKKMNVKMSKQNIGRIDYDLAIATHLKVCIV